MSLIKETIRKNLGYIPQPLSRIEMSEIARVNESAGHHWFSKDTMRFFRSRVSQSGIVNSDGTKVLFVSSEKCPGRDRVYSVRAMNLATGRVQTIGDFGGIPNVRRAWSWLKSQAKEV